MRQQIYIKYFSLSIPNVSKFQYSHSTLHAFKFIPKQALIQMLQTEWNYWQILADLRKSRKKLCGRLW